MSLDSQGTTLPEYIDFLLSPEIPLDFHVYVGNPDVKTQEKIGAVKWMLIARSKVLRVMLLKSKMRHEKEMSITDLEPDTFKNFLVFLYGHDNTSSLQLEAAVSLLCAAEKYDVEDLKSRLDDVITPQVTVDNVFVVLQNALVCENAPKLWETVNEIIQYRTEQVFSHTEFPKVSPEVLLHIVQQESLSVPEIDVWRAALNWATHQAQPVERVISAENLRLTILPFLKHI
ncbi:uncharacterized protein LOC124354019 isoform X2 [Homalodisca vitripennis]|uniref:uncharacterized protein LOC124354019 isoform X2 n=1 Tax=Homalodisca vitripennis TaxID=197043 RepID=UPI001EEB9E8B|nr:uncharacterized protein LOC124354019 isoform X2 [Homalodisca vitripennis]